MPDKQLVGTVRHFFPKAGVAIVDLSEPLSVGDTALIEGKTTNFEQRVESMQIEHESVEKADAGETVGLKVDRAVREGDKVYKVFK